MCIAYPKLISYGENKMNQLARQLSGRVGSSIKVHTFSPVPNTITSYSSSIANSLKWRRLRSVEFALSNQSRVINENDHVNYKYPPISATNAITHPLDPRGDCVSSLDSMDERYLAGLYDNCTSEERQTVS